MAKRVTSAKRADEEFWYNGFTVVVPRATLKAWKAQPDKQREMVVNTATAIDKIKNKPIIEGIRFKLELGQMPGEPLSKTAEKMANPGVKEAVLKLLKYAHYRNWHLSPIRNDFTRAVTMAALDGDHVFFKRLGEILKKPSKARFRLSKLKELLLFNWVGTGICFCWFTDQALLGFIKLTEKESFTMDAIRMERDRLSLPKLKPALVRSIKQDGKLILLLREKPVIVPDGGRTLEPRAQETEAARTLRAERHKK